MGHENRRDYGAIGLLLAKYGESAGASPATGEETAMELVAAELRSRSTASARALVSRGLPRLVCERPFAAALAASLALNALCALAAPALYRAIAFALAGNP
jgi:hypothetical protein